MSWKLKALLLALLVLSPLAGFAKGAYPTGSIGNDVSWPNCFAAVPANTAFGIVGLTGGKNFTKNSCLSAEVAAFQATGAPVALYANTGYPGLSYGRKYASWPKPCSQTNKLCLAYNYGYNAGAYAGNAANADGIAAPVWWLDVETGNSWTNDAKQNQQALLGMQDGLRQTTAVSTIGYYSTPRQWHLITKDWRNLAPNWVATGASLATAQAYCTGHDFTGGSTWITQYIAGIDYDFGCP